jgi:molybdopterin-guanine dinucleotide biosynthesis protein A
MIGTPTRSTLPPPDRHAHDCRTADGGPAAPPSRQDAPVEASACCAAILAGGLGRRFGGVDKGGLIVGGRSIVARQIDLLRQLTSDLIIVTGHQDAYAHLGVPIVPDTIAGAGPLGGICTALERSTQPSVLIVACDMPFLSLAFLRHLLTRVQGVDVALPKTADGYHPLCAAYARTALPAIRARIRKGRLDVVGLVREVRVAEIGPAELAPFDPGCVMLSNVNTPHDLRQACAWADRE